MYRLKGRIYYIGSFEQRMLLNGLEMFPFVALINVLDCLYNTLYNVQYLFPYFNHLKLDLKSIKDTKLILNI